MDNNSALEAFDALSQTTRLEIFRLLVRSGADGLPAGEIATAVEGRQNTVSSHLAVLARAGLVRSDRRGRTVCYRADYDAAGALVAYLLEDCCGGRPEVCGPLVDNLACLRPAACC